MVDAQHKLDDVRALQTRLVPLVAELNVLRTRNQHRRTSASRSVKYDEATVAEQQKRYAELVAASKAVAADVAERTRQMQSLSEELARSSGIKDELLGELDRVQSRQRDAVGQIQASEDQLARAEKMFKQLEGRRAQVAFGEKKLAAVETRLAEIKQLADELEQEHPGHREPRAARQRRSRPKSSRSTRSARAARRTSRTSPSTAAEVAALKISVDELLSRIAETDERIVVIDARRKLVDEVQTKANAIVHLLDDVRINLETLGEQKAVVDHVAEKVAQLEFMLQEARQHAAHAPARARAGRADRAGHQAAAVADGAYRREDARASE